MAPKFQRWLKQDFPSAALKVSLGIHVNTDDWTLSVPDFQLLDLSDELHLWLSRKHFTIKELQSILGKLSFRSRPFWSHFSFAPSGCFAELPLVRVPTLNISPSNQKCARI